MTIDWFKTKSGVALEPSEVIKRLRTNMIVHSYIYYRMDENIISDDAWQNMANDLVEIQSMFPEPIGFYDELFSDWDASTGSHLVYIDEDYWIAKARYLIRLFKERSVKEK